MRVEYDDGLHVDWSPQEYARLRKAKDEHSEEQKVFKSSTYEHVNGSEAARLQREIEITDIIDTHRAPWEHVRREMRKHGDGA